MSQVIKGTRQGKEVGVIKSQHSANFKKIRCMGCKVGFMVKVETTGGSVYRCNRCGREAKETKF